jgi:two-component system sensor histidine kinase BarA
MLLAVVVGYGTYHLSYNSMLEQFKREHEWLITHFAEHAASHLHSEDFTVQASTRQVITDHVTTEGFLMRIAGSDEPFLIGDNDPKMFDLYDAESPKGSIYRDHSWYFYAPINATSTLPGGRIPNWVVMRTSDETLEQSRMAILRKYVLIAFGAIAVYLLLLQRLLEHVLGPIRSLVDYLKDIESGSLESLAVERGPEDIRKLAVAINRLAISVRESNLLMQNEVARATEKLQITLIELEEAMEAKDQFLANMSHELPTPLNAVMGFSRLLVDEHDERVRREHRRVIEVSSTMIDDLLEFSKAHSGQYKLEEINFERVPALKNLQSIHQPNAHSKGLTLSFEIADDMPEYLCADPVRLAQLISKLINNAITFTDSGFVVLALSCDPIATDRLLLKGSVKDSGKGIAASKIPLLFAPFS